MQKLAILLLISLQLSSLLFAEESLLLDRDILYWKPAGPDIAIPDVYILPDFSLFSEDDMHSDLYFPLLYEKKEAAGQSGPDLTVSDLSLNWEPPAIQSFGTGEGKRTEGRLSLTGSYPYGSGLSLSGASGIVSYDTAGVYSHHSAYPHWVRTGMGFHPGSQDLSGSVSIRSLGEVQIFSLVNWRGSTEGNPFGFSGLARFRSASVPDSSDVNWAILAGTGLDILLKPVTVSSSIETEYLSDPLSPGLRLSPSLNMDDTFQGKSGDWGWEAGALVDLYSDDFEFRIFPSLRLSYLNYGHVSFYLDSRGTAINEIEYYHFQTEERFSLSDLDHYRWQSSAAGFHFTSDEVQLYTAAGFNYGDMPHVAEYNLMPVRSSVPFAEIIIYWHFKGGKVTEFNSFADYQDTGDFRFFLLNRWDFEGFERFRRYSVFIRGGNRPLLRGYRNFFEESSDILAGLGAEIEFNKPLKADFYLDFNVQDLNLEGGIGLSCSY